MNDKNLKVLIDELAKNGVRHYLRQLEKIALLMVDYEKTEKSIELGKTIYKALDEYKKK